MTKAEFLTLWQENADGRHNQALSLEVARVFSHEKYDKSKPWIPFYDFVDGQLVKRKPTN